MKNVLSCCVISLLFLISCNISSSLDGQYIKIKDNDRGSSLNVLNMNLVKEVNFGNNMCRFDYFGTTMGVNTKLTKTMFIFKLEANWEHYQWK